MGNLHRVCKACLRHVFYWSSESDKEKTMGDGREKGRVVNLEGKRVILLDRGGKLCLD